MSNPTIETVPTVEQIPKEIIQLIPLYNGDKRLLNLYLKKCQYVLERYKGSHEQNLYVYNVLTSRLRDDAAALLSEREDIVTWSTFRELLIQHFGDPRSEACINIELESLKIKPGESYLEFCNRIQSVRSALMSKVNMIDDTDLKRAKSIIYKNTALNVFLYNLPENMIRVVRLKTPETLEAALSLVLEEVNFLEQYNTKNRIQGQSHSSGSRLVMTPAGYKPLLPGNMSAPKFNFGIPQNKMLQGQPSNASRQQFGYVPQTQQFGYKAPQPFGYRPPVQQKFGYRPPQPQQFGYRPSQPQPFGYRHPQPQPFGYKPPQQFGYKPPTNFNVPQQQKPQLQNTDVSMRTAQPKSNVPQSFKVNELCTENYEPYYEEYYPNYDDEYNYDLNYYDETIDCEQQMETEIQDENFQEIASNNKKS
ncbi:uncharacterized protein LOC142985999 [Anticarsia gemmatalis]|uniref:uncharacterized protein LOC142985999 n=1 Tax=Anticarsia gemmatalis TaxID=129554 RepID=UPI003F764AC0